MHAWVLVFWVVHLCTNAETGLWCPVLAFRGPRLANAAQCTRAETSLVWTDVEQEWWLELPIKGNTKIEGMRPSETMQP